MDSRYYPGRKTLILVVSLMLLCVMGVLYADVTVNAAPPRFYTAESLAMGGSFSILSSGYESVFSNPAGIARENGLEFIGIGMGPRVNLEEEMIPYLDEWLTQGYQKTEYFVNESTLVNGDLHNGIGGIYTMSGGGSFAGFGAGLMYTVEPLFTQKREGEPVHLSYQANAGFGGGLSYGIPLSNGKLYLGASFMQLAVVYAEEDIAEEELTSYLNDEGGKLSSIPCSSMTGYGMNFGAIYERGPFLLGAGVKNVGASELEGGTLSLGEALAYQKGILNLEGTEDNFFFGNFIPNASTDLGVGSSVVSIPISVVLSTGLDFDFGKIAGLKVAGEYEYAFSGADDGEDDMTFWKSLHIGGEFELLDTLRVRAGINQGYLTGGLGVTVVNLFHLIDVTFNGTYYATELGKYAGQIQSEGMLFEVGVNLHPDF